MVWQYLSSSGAKGAVEHLADGSDFPFWCLGDKASGNSGGRLVLGVSASIGGIYFFRVFSFLMVTLTWQSLITQLFQAEGHLMPWNNFSSLKIRFLEGTPFGFSASFAQ